MTSQGEDQDSKRRIQQMINFIIQEASEKSEEIKQKAKEEYQIEQGKLINPERIRLNQEYDRKIKELEIKRKIEFSTQVNKARLQVLRKREELMNGVNDKTFLRLAEIKKDQKKYQQLLKDLIVQGLIRIDETQIEVSVVKEDYELVKNILDDAVKTYKDTWKKQVGEDRHKLEVTLQQKTFLSADSVGGIVLKARQGKIILDNTLSSRLNVSTEALLPILRGRLFGVTAHNGVIYEDDEHKDN